MKLCIRDTWNDMQRYHRRGKLTRYSSFMYPNIGPCLVDQCTDHQCRKLKGLSDETQQTAPLRLAKIFRLSHCAVALSMRCVLSNRDIEEGGELRNIFVVVNSATSILRTSASLLSLSRLH